MDFSTAFQVPTAIDDVEFVRVLRVIQENGVLYPTPKSMAWGSMESDFHIVPFNDFDVAMQNQDQRRAGIASTQTASDAAVGRVNECENKLAKYEAKSNQKLRGLRQNLATEMAHFRNLNASRVKQEASIATHGVELEELRKQRQMEEASAHIVDQFKTSRWENYESFIEKLFLVPFDAAVYDCNVLRLVAKRFVVLIHAMNHVRALGYSLTRGQVMFIYNRLHPGDPVDLSSSPLLCLFEGRRDYENFETEFLESSLVTSDADGAHIEVSDHVFRGSLYDPAKIPNSTVVEAILDKFEQDDSP